VAANVSEKKARKATMEAMASFMILVVEVLDSKGFLFEQRTQVQPAFIPYLEIKISPHHCCFIVFGTLGVD